MHQLKSPNTRAFGKPSESKFPSGVASEKQRAEDGQTQGTYIVGRKTGCLSSIFAGDMVLLSGCRTRHLLGHQLKTVAVCQVSNANPYQGKPSAAMFLSLADPDAEEAFNNQQ
ncbi:hypothetical protein C1H46_016741 [Malus baccata]|uniref:Uncharacterized protein n=1 Tax=Malus baccata TaxID=106549 RepID=A0A540MFX5_MALBA|nr:hypothetical protein C1H46_016741 [Malus baccata]